MACFYGNQSAPTTHLLCIYSAPNTHALRTRSAPILALYTCTHVYSLSIPIKEQCVFVCLFVCLLFIGHTTFVHFAALPPSGRECRSRSRGRPRARGRKHAQREHARACRTTSQRKNRTLMPFKNKTVRARACCRIRNCRDFQKKGKRKPTCHFPSSVYSLPSLGVFTFRIVLNAPDSISFVTSHSHISF